MKRAIQRQIRLTVVFSGDEEQSKIAFENAVRCVLSKDEKSEVIK